MKPETAALARTIASRCFAVRVRRLARVVTRIYDAELEPHGVTTAQLNLLTAIAAMESPRPAQLIHMLEVEKSTLSRDLKRMVELGWVRSAVAESGRGRPVALTPAGERLLVKTRAAWERAQERAQEALPSELFPPLMTLLG